MRDEVIKEISLKLFPKRVSFESGVCVKDVSAWPHLQETFLSCSYCCLTQLEKWRLTLYKTTLNIYNSYLNIHNKYDEERFVISIHSCFVWQNPFTLASSWYLVVFLYVWRCALKTFRVSELCISFYDVTKLLSVLLNFFLL